MRQEIGGSQPRTPAAKTRPKPASGDIPALKADIELTRGEMAETMRDLAGALDVKAQAGQFEAETKLRLEELKSDAKRRVAGLRAQATTFVGAHQQQLVIGAGVAGAVLTVMVIRRRSL